MDQLNFEIEKPTMDHVYELTGALDGVNLYENSVHEYQGSLFFMIRNGLNKQLIIEPGTSNGIIKKFKGKMTAVNGKELMECELSHQNAEALRSIFSFTNSVLVGKKNSYGFGDRLGNAGPAHLRSLKGTGFVPILAQQSIRELERTKRTAEEVMDAATWAIFQEGYHDGFGSDGDHLKTFDDIDRMVKAGYTMFTIDPSAFVENGVKEMTAKQLEEAYHDLPWDEIDDEPKALKDRLLNINVELRNGFVLSPEEQEILQGMVKYGRVITHTRKMAEYITEAYPDHPAELELSVDETDEPTTLFEHYLVTSELDRLGVSLVSLAPRFCGHFEKGIDFKGDLDQFRDEYIQHLAIAEKFGGYKLSIHSGSDKFSVYKVIGSLNAGTVHVKTAGTSYLEAIRTVAQADPEFFRELMSFSIRRFEEDKKTYHISADPERIPDLDSLNAGQLAGLLDNDDARQVLHVAFGSVLSGDLPEAKGYKTKLMKILEENEELHEKNLIRHFEKHLSPFN
jgi:tagaturonate epimerase